MTHARSPAGYPDSRFFLNKAIEAKKGAFAIFTTNAKANSWRNRLYSLRSAERDRSRKFYPPDSPTYDKTPWDGLTFFMEILDDGRCQVTAVHDEETALRMITCEVGELP